MTTSVLSRCFASYRARSRSILEVDYAEYADVMFSAAAFRTALCGYAITLGWCGQALILGAAAGLYFKELLTLPSSIPADIVGALAPTGEAGNMKKIKIYLKF